MIRQVHGSWVTRLTDATDSGGAVPRRELEEADGQATSRVGIAPMVLTADCLPIALAGGGAVAVLHAGWRGLAEGVLTEGVAALRELGRDEPLEAAIGPGAGGCCYEVGEELRRRFAPYGERACNGSNLDLKFIAREQLERTGVQAVHDVGLCTICAPESLFFSHRRDRGLTGRQAGIAWLT
jgi:YfiH family protein